MSVATLRDASDAGRRLVVVATPGCPIAQLRIWFGPWLEVDEVVGDDSVALEQLVAEPTTCLVVISRHPFMSIAAGVDQRAAEERWTSANGNAIDVVERVGPDRAVAVRFEAVLADPSAFVGLLRERFGATIALGERGDELGPGEIDAWRRVQLAQRPSRAVRVVAEELGYDVDAFVAPSRPAPAPLGDADAARLRAPGSQPRPITPVARHGRLPASPAQERLLFIDDLDPRQSTYNLPIAFRVRGRLDVALLARAFGEILRRHESLRTDYALVDGVYTQTITPPPVGVIECIELVGPVDAVAGDDLDDLDDLERRVDAEIRKVVAAPFDLRHGPKVRMALLHLGDDDHVLVIVMHHVASDGWSMAYFTGELAEIYDAETSGTLTRLAPLPIQYADYAVWHRAQLGAAATTAAIEHWKVELAGAPALELPTDRPHALVRTFRAAAVRYEIPTHVVVALRSATRAAGVTHFMLLLAAYVATMQRWTRQDDIVVGTATAGRPSEETAGLIGLFANNLALRFRIDPAWTFRDLAHEVKRVVLGAFARDDAPFDRVVAAINPTRDRTRSPIYQTMLVLNSESAPLLSLPGVEVEQLAVEAGATELDLSVIVTETPSHTTAQFEYSEDLFDRETVERIVATWGVVLEAVVADLDLPLADLPVMREADVRLVEEWSGARQDPDLDIAGPTASARIAERMEHVPDVVAIRTGDRAITYGELGAEVRRIAAGLRRAGIGPGSVVGVAAERSPSMVAAMLAVWRAGAAYVPLDPALPDDRLAYVADDAGVGLVVSGREGIAFNWVPAGVPVIGVPTLAGEDLPTAEGPGDRDESALDGLAYILYTSGSTGRPKGVEIEHLGVTNFLLAMTKEPGLGPHDVVLGIATISFDISVLELFLPLLVGASIALATADEVVDGRRLAELATRSGATLVQATPTTWWMLIDAGWQGGPNLRILCGGEALTPALALALGRRSAEVWNVYGPTESTVWATVHRVDPSEVSGERIPIGRPIANVSCRIVDASGHLVPIGVPGELLIGGVGVGRGYHGRPGLTAEQFVADPIAPGGRAYRTGDLVRWRADGVLDHLGRIDHQVKVRGHRIELGEIETVLRALPDVADAVVAEDNGVRLVGYVIPADPDAPPTAVALRSSLSRQLPEYMIPSRFIWMERFPLTSSRKIDRRALPPPDDAVVETSGGAACGETEEMLVDIWGQVLGAVDVGTHDNFFDLGGYSLLATRMFALVEQRTGKRMPMASLFQAPTIAELADAFDNHGVDAGWSSLVPIQTSGTRRPFFYVAPYLISVLQFVHLGEALRNDRPLYGLQPQGLDGVLAPHATIEEMATHYIAELKTIQCEGPYVLGGHCAGAWVAFEMARQLEAGGEAIGALILVDHGPPGSAPEPIEPWRYLLNRFRFYLRDGRLRHAVRWQTKVAIDRLITRRVGGQASRVEANVRERHRVAFVAYRGGTIEHDIEFVRSAESVALEDKSWFEHWEHRTSGRLSIQDVSGTHANLLELPWVLDLADAMRKIFAAVDVREHRDASLAMTDRQTTT